MAKAGKYPRIAVFWKDQLRALFDPLAILCWIRRDRVQALAIGARCFRENDAYVGAIYLRRWARFDCGLPFQEIFRGAFSPSKKWLDRSLKVQLFAPAAFWALLYILACSSARLLYSHRGSLGTAGRE
jgi:hypothetical protein